MSRTLASWRSPSVSTAELGPPPGIGARTVTALIVGVPFLAVVLAMIRFWGHGVHLRDVVLMVVTYFAVGHGVAIGFHRLASHRSFVARRPLKLVLVGLGSMAFEGGPIGWAASHRRHHVFADTPGDPHSPRRRGRGGRLRGLWHAHIGWLFTDRGEPEQRRVADLLADRDMVVMNTLFPVWCVVSLGIPFGLGWLLGGTLSAALSALLWAGVVRVFLVQHVTWGVNSLGHTFGRRPFMTDDDSTNIRALALIGMGDSWHNSHHAFPRSARHGVLPGQWDSSALLIGWFERLGWADHVIRPSADSVQARLR
jgi:stearoyl-CoA desaturase (delta-9 desaturase)